MESWRISNIRAREVLNNMGMPVLEVDVFSEDGRMGRASASFGISAGVHEVAIRRDGGERYNGMGVLGPMAACGGEILTALKGMDCRDQRAVDEALVGLDGTPDKSRLGGNTVCSVSMAVAKLGALHRELPLFMYLAGALCNTIPRPLFNFCNGGPYSVSGNDFQEYHVIPLEAESVAESVRMAVDVFRRMPAVIKKMHGDAAYRSGHLGGIAAPVPDPEKVLDTLMAAIEDAGYGGRFALSIDCATSHLYDRATDTYSMVFGKLTTGDMIGYFTNLVKKYPIAKLEDPLHEDDFEGFARLNAAVPTLICGDDLFVNSLERLRRGADLGSAGAMIFKPNMVGSVTEAMDAARYAVSRNMIVIPSMRAAASPGDPTTDLGVAAGARLMKVGAPLTGERTLQQNKLIRIEEYMGKRVSMLPGPEVRQWLTG